MIQTLPAVFTLTERAEKATTREEALEILKIAATMDNVAAEWLNDTEQIGGQFTK